MLLELNKILVGQSQGSIRKYFIPGHQQSAPEVFTLILLKTICYAKLNRLFAPNQV